MLMWQSVRALTPSVCHARWSQGRAPACTTKILICIVYVVLYQFALLLVFSRGLGGCPWMLDLKTGPHHWRGGRSDGTSKSYNFNWIKTIYASFLRANNKITFCKQFRMSLAVYADCCVSPGIRMPLLLSLRSTVFWFSESKSINCSLYSCKRRLTLTWPYIVIHFKSVTICSPKLQTVFYLELNLIRFYKFNRLFTTCEILNKLITWIYLDLDFFLQHFDWGNLLVTMYCI